jgi:pimeloyl-ACP methyl ester carboxylesterase
MEIVHSADGTALAFDRFGDGPAIIMVAGAFNTRATTEPLGRALATQVTVLNYDRRGRGDSGDTAPYAVDREIEDLAALVTAAGGEASIFGYSSGAVLALLAAAHGLPITTLTLYEPPLSPGGDGSSALRTDLTDRLVALVAAGRRGEAVELFQGEAVGMPPEVVAQLRHAPFRPALEDIAHTLAYEAAIIGDRSMPPGVASIDVPALVLTGGESPAFLQSGARAVAETLPKGSLAILPGQTHDINPEATAPVIAAFLTARHGSGVR